jgi:hypothetical protein
MKRLSVFLGMLALSMALVSCLSLEEWGDFLGELSDSGFLDSLASSVQQAEQPQGGSQVAQAPSTSNTPAPSTRNWQGAYDNNVRRLESAIGSYNRMTTATARSGQLQTIRGYQRDLRDIRSQARSDGVTLSVNPLENWNP